MKKVTVLFAGVALMFAAACTRNNEDASTGTSSGRPETMAPAAETNPGVTPETQKPSDIPPANPVSPGAGRMGTTPAPAPGTGTGAGSATGSGH
jgi:hypothetical protein